MNPTVYLNGEWLPLEAAKVSVLDRGFIFGDGVYEVVPVYGGHPFRLDGHLDRLDRSLAAIRLANPLPRATWQDVLQRLVQENGGGDQSLYVHVTRGVARRDHGFPPADTPPTLFAMSSPLTPPPAELLARGIAAITVEDIRWKYCHIKAIALLPNILLRQQALDVGAHEAILVRDGQVTEGAASNVFVVERGVITTPPKGELLLPGITRDLVVELAREHGLALEEAPIEAARLRQVDELWVTSSTKEVLPVTQLDDQPIGDGRPGPVWQNMIALYQACKARLRSGAER